MQQQPQPTTAQLIAAYKAKGGKITSLPPARAKGYVRTNQNKGLVKAAKANA